MELRSKLSKSLHLCFENYVWILLIKRSCSQTLRDVQCQNFFSTHFHKQKEKIPTNLPENEKRVRENLKPKVYRIFQLVHSLSVYGFEKVQERQDIKAKILSKTLPLNGKVCVHSN